MATQEIKNEEIPEESESPETEEGLDRHPLQIPVSEEFEKRIVMIVRDDFTAAEEARRSADYGITSKGEKLGFDEWYKQLIDLYNSRREPKTVPWKFSSNRSLRIAASILDTLHARLLPAIVNDDFVKWNPTEPTDKPKIERINKLMHWWLWVNSGVQDFLDIWVKMTLGFGDALTETCWDVEVIDSGETIEKPITDEEGNPQTEQDGQPAKMSFRDIRLKEKTKSRVYMKDQVFLQSGSKNIHKEPVILQEEILFRDLEQGEIEGQFINVTDKLRAMLQEGVEVSVGVSDSEAQAIRDIKIRNKPIKIQKEYLNFDSDGDGFPEDIRVIVSLDHNIFLGAVAVKNLTKSGKRPIHFQKFDNRLNRPEENDGEGVLEKIKELAEEIDAIFNQLTDANTLGILRPGFYDPMGNLDAPVLKLAPNKLTPVPDPSRNVFFPDFSVPVQQLLEAIRLVLEFIERLTAASSFVFGKEGQFAGGSGTATQTNAIIQSAETRFQRPAERLRKGAGEIFNQHLDLLQLNIPKGLEKRILGEKHEPVFEDNELSSEGISGQYDAYILPDPAMGSKQANRDIWNMLYSLLLQNPIVGTDPVKIYRVTAELVKSFDQNPTELLGPAPSEDDIDDPKEENTLIVQGDFGRVRAQIMENHLLHIQEHMGLMQSPSLAQLPPALIEQVQQFTMQHIQEHQQMMQLMMSLSQQTVGGKSGGGQPGNPETNQGAPNASGVEQTSGPLGDALNQQREGQSGTPQGI